MSESLAMGHYGFYVWTAFAVSFSVRVLGSRAAVAWRRGSRGDLRARLGRQENRGRPGTPASNESHP